MSQAPALPVADFRPFAGMLPESLIHTISTMGEATLRQWCAASNSETKGCKELLMCRVLINEYHIAKIERTVLGSMILMDRQSPGLRQWCVRGIELKQTMTTYERAVSEVINIWQARILEMVRKSNAGAIEAQRLYDDEGWHEGMKEIALSL